jgi:hypothetical protein
MLSKESKINVLENFYSLDYIFFGKRVAKVKSCCPLIREEYLAIKGALMSVHIEMLKHMKHSPKPLSEKVNFKRLSELAAERAKAARFAAQKVVVTELARRDIKADIKSALAENKNLDVSALVEAKIREKAFRLAVDNVLVARPLAEAKSVKSLNDWTGRVLEDSYKILRDNLCETAMMILDNE